MLNIIFNIILNIILNVTLNILLNILLNIMLSIMLNIMSKGGNDGNLSFRYIFLLLQVQVITHAGCLFQSTAGLLFCALLDYFL